MTRPWCTPDMVAGVTPGKGKYSPFNWSPKAFEVLFSHRNTVLAFVPNKTQRHSAELFG